MACKALHDMTLLSFSAFLSHIPQDPQSHLHQLLSWNVSSTLQPQDSGTGFWVYGPVNLLLLSTQNIPLSSMFSTKITTWQTPSFSLNLGPVRLILISSFKITNLHPLLQFLPVIHLALHFLTEVKWKSLSHVWLFAISLTIQSMEFSRPEYWSE